MLLTLLFNTALVEQRTSHFDKVQDWSVHFGKAIAWISHTHSLATFRDLTPPWLFLMSEQYREMGHKCHCNHTLLTTTAITSLNDRPFGPRGKTCLGAIFHLANGWCLPMLGNTDCCCDKKKGNKAWLGRATLEIFQMIAYFVGDNGIIRANTAWQGRINNQCKTQRSGTTG